MNMKIYFVIMENIIQCKDGAIVFDIKGFTGKSRSSLGLAIKPGNVYKDTEFTQARYRISGSEKAEFMESISADCEILNSEKIMDYSLLIGVYENATDVSQRYAISRHNHIMCAGIIDILQVYNFKKAAERNFKKIFRGKEDISSINHNTYYQRIMDYLAQNI